VDPINSEQIAYEARGRAIRSRSRFSAESTPVRGGRLASDQADDDGERSPGALSVTTLRKPGSVTRTGVSPKRKSPQERNRKQFQQVVEQDGSLVMRDRVVAGYGLTNVRRTR
jgi:hypothetical protein